MKGKTDTVMKTKNIVTQLILSASLVAALSFASGCATNSSTADQMKPMKGGEHMLMLNDKIETTQQLAALKPDDSIAMVCSKCKTVYVSRVKQGTKGAQVQLAGGTPTEMIGTHACAGCGGKWTITGVGKGATTELKHTCSMCGDDSAFCCATKPGSSQTEGMEKK